MHKHSVILFPGGMMPPHWGRVPPVPWRIHARSAYGCPSLCSAHHRFALTRQKNLFREFPSVQRRQRAQRIWHQVPCLNKIPQFFEPIVFLSRRVGVAGPRVFCRGGLGGRAEGKKNGGILGDTELSQQNSTILRAVSRFLSLN